MAAPLLQENVWMQRQRFEEAEAHFYAVQAGTANNNQGGGSSLIKEISEARQQIQNALKQPGGVGGASQSRIDNLEKENRELKKVTADLKAMVLKLESRVGALEKGGKGDASSAKAAPAPAADDDDEDIDLFGSEDEEEQAAQAERKKKLLADYAAKKAKKPVLIAKSSVVFDVKPWDDETDMEELTRMVRTIVKDGLHWGASQLKEVAYGLKKLVIMCTVEDDKIGVEDLREEIEGFEDLVQSVDIAAFNKI